MRVADAPQPGWYPDPAGGVRLRWWDGTDWSDDFRSRPSVGQLGGRPARQAGARRHAQPRAGRSRCLSVGALRLADTRGAISQVRRRLGSRPSARPTCSPKGEGRYQADPAHHRYTSKFLRWIRIGAVSCRAAGRGILFHVSPRELLRMARRRIDNVSTKTPVLLGLLDGALLRLKRQFGCGRFGVSRRATTP